MERTVLHCDLNNYFASVECLSHPEWKTVPMAVCGSVEERHGIVLAKNYPAKAAGIRTAMTVPEALRLCPNLVIAKPHYQQYVAYSRMVHALYARYTDQIEPFGIDECWLDVTGSRRLFGSGRAIADRLRREVAETLGLTISVGVSFCKVLAKLGSDMKKPDATTVIRPEELPGKVWPLPVQDLLGVGYHTRERLNGLGIYTIGDLAAMDPHILSLRLGKAGVQLWQFANGLERAPVRRIGDCDPPKSVSKSTTCRQDLTTPEQVRRVLVGLAEEVSSGLRRAGFYAGVIKLYLRDHTLCSRQHQTAVSVPVRSVRGMVAAAMEMLDAHWSGVPLRSVGIGAEKLVPEQFDLQTNLFFDLAGWERTERLEQRVDQIRERMGPAAVVRASQLLPALQIPLGSGFDSMQF